MAAGWKGGDFLGYLLGYLLEDEKKHTHMLEALNNVQKGMYPYG